MTKVTIDKALLEQVHRALQTEQEIYCENDPEDGAPEYLNEAVRYLQAALAEPAPEPVAWMTFDGEGGYDLRLYDMNESYRNDYIKRNGEKYASWVQPLYASPPTEPVLEDIEQYRLQMAGISTAAFGYWKAGDSIHPDYDTLALRDVAKLYAKYDALYKASPPVEHSCKWPTCRTEEYQQMLATQVAIDLFDIPAEVPMLSDEEVGMLTVFDGLQYVETPVLADFIRYIQAAVRQKVKEVK